MASMHAAPGPGVRLVGGSEESSSPTGDFSPRQTLFGMQPQMGMQQPHQIGSSPDLCQFVAKRGSGPLCYNERGFVGPA
eukprot:7453177-Pyramimonas_sp.AAC.2